MNINSRYLQINYTVFKLIIQGALTLTNEELIQLIKNGENVKDNIYLLYIQNLPLMKLWGKRYNEIIGADDVLQECYIALHNAVKTFEIEKGYKFTTYLQSAVKTHFSRMSNKYSNTNISQDDKRLLMQYNALNEKEQQTAGRNISIIKSASLLSCSVKDIQRILQYINLHNCVSIDKAITNNSDSDMNIIETISSNINIAEEYEDKEITIHSTELFPLIANTLNDKQQADVIMLRFQEGKTLKETGELLNISSSKVRTLEYNALKQLRINKIFIQRVYSLLGV